jgi:hypothetical protein
MPPTLMVRALTLLYEATGGEKWTNNSNWLVGEPCVDGWFGVHCCPQSLPILALRGDGTEACSSDGSQANGPAVTQGSAACHSGNVTGTALDHATCVVVKLLLPSNNLAGPLDAVDSLTSEHSLCGLQFLQHLNLSGNTLIGPLPPLLSCLPQLTSIDLTQARFWDQAGGLTGPIPEWLLNRVDSGLMTDLLLANNAFDDPEAGSAAVTISRLWQQCSGALSCSGVPPITCSAFNRRQRYEVQLNGMECVR